MYDRSVVKNRIRGLRLELKVIRGIINTLKKSHYSPEINGIGILNNLDVNRQ